MVNWWFGAWWFRFGFLGFPKIKGMPLHKGIPRIPSHQPKPFAELRYDSENKIRAIICSWESFQTTAKHTPHTQKNNIFGCFQKKRGKTPQNGWWKSWKTLLIHGWFGGEKPLIFGNIHVIGSNQSSDQWLDVTELNIRRVRYRSHWIQSWYITTLWFGRFWGSK